MRTRLIIAAVLVLLTAALAGVLLKRNGDRDGAHEPVVGVPTILEFPRFEVDPIDANRFATQTAERTRECAELRVQVTSDIAASSEPILLTGTVTRAGVTFGVPKGVNLSPEGDPDSVQWFFSGPIGPIDPAVGLRLSVGVFASPGDFPLVGLLDHFSATRSPVTPVRSSADVFRAYGFENSLIDAFGCDVRAGAPVRPLAVRRMQTRASMSDDYGNQILYLHQEALLELADGRILQMMLDGLSSIPWGVQISIFESIIESVEL